MTAIDLDTGLLQGVDVKLSPNCDARPEGIKPDLIVLHAISLPPGEYDGDAVSEYFLNKLDPAAHPYFAKIYQTKVSAHLYIRRDGSVVQYVPLHQRAWHAGISRYQGRDDCNNFSIGIELEGTTEEPFTEKQYVKLLQVANALFESYDMKQGSIVGHEHIAPGRKKDPGPLFDWSRLEGLLEKEPVAESIAQGG